MANESTLRTIVVAVDGCKAARSAAQFAAADHDGHQRLQGSA